jgi:VIT1/CCC1 family predicted Fe2+/Mn2+ transporter
MKHSYIKGLSFGLASGIVTTLGLMVGLYTGTQSKLAVLGGILTIAVADAMSDAFGIHLSEKSSEKTKKLEIWESTLATFAAKLFFALTFVIPVVLLDLGQAIIISIFWGLFLLAIISIMIARWRKESISRMIAEHWGIAVAVVVLSYYVGVFIDTYFTSMCG